MIDTKALRELCERATRHSNYRDEARSKLNAALHNAATELLDEIDALRGRLRAMEEVVMAARALVNSPHGKSSYLAVVLALSAFDAEGKK